MSARDELAKVVYKARWVDGIKDVGLTTDSAIADAILAAGYRKPKVLGYMVVSRRGSMVGNQHEDRESAQKVADEWTADCQTAGIDWDYRVAEITEPA
jgi:hypothetical protein